MPIIIRHSEPEDYSAIQQIYIQPEIIRGTLQLPFPSRELWRQRLADPPSGLYSLVACIDTDILGHLGLRTYPDRPRRRHAAEVGMAVHPDWHRRGIGHGLLEAALDLADNWLNLQRLELTVYTDNERALALYRRFDFEVEGTLRAFAFREGQLVDAFQMARLNSNAYGESDDVGETTRRLDVIK